MKRIIRIMRNWLMAIIGMSCFFGIIISTLVILPVSVMRLISQEEIELKNPIVFIGVVIFLCFIMILCGVFIRLLFYKIDKDPDVQDKIKRINNAKLKDVSSNFFDFFN